MGKQAFEVAELPAGSGRWYWRERTDNEFHGAFGSYNDAESAAANAVAASRKVAQAGGVMPTPAFTWTNPFHGIQHLRGLRGGFQITVEDRGSFAETLVFLPGHGFNARITKHANVVAARSFGEAQASELEADT